MCILKDLDFSPPMNPFYPILLIKKKNQHQSNQFLNMSLQSWTVWPRCPILWKLQYPLPHSFRWGRVRVEMMRISTLDHRLEQLTKLWSILEDPWSVSTMFEIKWVDWPFLCDSNFSAYCQDIDLSILHEHWNQISYFCFYRSVVGIILWDSFDSTWRSFL